MTTPKTLYLLRHAKSSWDNPRIKDRDRPLKKRGIRNIADMGKRLASQGIAPQLIISSPAKRALITACGIADALGYSSKSIDVREEVYFCGTPSLIHLLAQQNDELDSVMLVGHNPDLSTLLHQLTGVSEDMPTCAFASIELRRPSWADIAGGGTLRLYDYPKSMKELL